MCAHIFKTMLQVKSSFKKRYSTIKVKKVLKPIIQLISLSSWSLRDGFNCLMELASRIFHFKWCEGALDNIIQLNWCPGLFFKCLEGSDFWLFVLIDSCNCVSDGFTYVIISTTTNSVVNNTTKMFNVIFNFK